MLWLKRNLFLAVTGLVALLLLGGGVFVVMAGRARNVTLDEEVEATRNKLNNFYGKDPFPHATNIDTAKKEVAKLRTEVQKTIKYFAPVPVERMDTRSFLEMRDRTLAELRDAAQKSGAGLPAPAPYAFSFDTQRGKSAFGPGTFPSVPEQMAEIKALCAALYDARVTRILNIRRARASADDERSSNVQDYTDRALGIESNANAQAMSHPFELTFTCFSGEIGQVLTSLAKSPYGFVVKAVQVELEDLNMPNQPAGGPGFNPPGPANPGQPFPPPRPGRPQPGRPGAPGNPPRPAVPVAAPVAGNPNRPPANDLPVVLLKEKRLKTTLLVYAIKPAK